MESHPQKSIQRSIVHILSQYHDGLWPGDNPNEAGDVGMVKMSHDARLGQEVTPTFVRLPHLQGLDGYELIAAPGQPQATLTDVSEFTWHINNELDWLCRNVDNIFIGICYSDIIIKCKVSILIPNFQYLFFC